MPFIVFIIFIGFILWLISLKFATKIGDFAFKHIINPIKDIFK